MFSTRRRGAPPRGSPRPVPHRGGRRAHGARPTTTLLDWLRARRGLSGAKEGCAEGDCGACTVAVRSLEGGRLVTRPLNACIQLLPMLNGSEVVTVEALAGPGGALHPAQAAIAEAHGSQCGFCASGFVMSLWCALRTEPEAPSRARIDALLAGNLCRCTGYGPIIAAVSDAFARRRAHWEEGDAAAAERLRALIPHARLSYEAEGRRFLAPTDLDAFADLVADHPEATVLGGATDVGLWVTKDLFDPETIIWTGRVGALREMREEGGALRIGAAVTYAEAAPRIAALYPDIGALIGRIGGAQVRAAGTVGGNVANGSPIGDMPPALIAAGAALLLRQGRARREMPLEDFFLDYRRQDRRPGEPAARCRGLAEPRHRPRPDRGRLHPGARLADDRGAVVGREGPAAHPCAQHLQDPHRLGPAGRFPPVALGAGREPRIHHPPLEGGGRAAADAGQRRLPRAVGRRARGGERGLSRARRAGDAGAHPRSRGARAGMSDLRGAEIAGGLARMGRAVLAVVTEARGSTPREAGAAMLIGPRQTLGTIGGGAAEHRALAAARAMLAEPAPAPATLAFPLGPELDQCCGGAMTVALAPLDARDAPRFATGGAALWPGGPIWREALSPRPVLIYGAGHVGAALARALAPLPFTLRWVDARAGFAADAPEGVGIVETPLPEAEAAAAPDGALHLVLTHSHALDLEIVAAALRAQSGFVGLIGSATKRATFLRRLRARGLSEAALARLTCPIGLPGLRDKRPAAIAASVAAQLLQVDGALAAQRRGAA